MMTIVDYGVGNVQAFMNTFKRLSLPATRATTAEGLRGATQIILPGVGAFDNTMRKFNESAMRESVEAL
ncbi:MAG: imidazole glycerol phosphate synthase subunit HisH, partial [Acidobacteriota bacterium]